MLSVRPAVPQILAITPGKRSQPEAACAWLSALLQGLDQAGVAPGSAGVQLRAKGADETQLLRLGKSLQQTLASSGHPLLLNSSHLGPTVETARLLALVDGIHMISSQLRVSTLPARLSPGPYRLLGASCHSIEELEHAQRLGAHYAVLGPIFDTPSKRGFGDPLGLSVLESATTQFGGALPILAIGGIDQHTAADAMQAGAAGVAGIRVFSDPHATAQLCAAVA